MKVSDFINLFKTDGLGKKRQHSGYRVMDGDHCQLLVRATKRWGVPGGSELIGIYFGHGVCLFHDNFYKLRDSVTDGVSDPKPVINKEILKENDEHLINSGIIGFDEDKGLLLLEIGETPWLFEQDPEYVPNTYNYWKWHFNTGTQVSRRVATVAEAENDIVLPDDVVSRLGYLLKMMPSDFEPISTSEVDKKLLMNPPNPFNYGLTLDDLTVETMYGGGGRGCAPLFLKQGVAQEAKATQFKFDVAAYNKATERFDNREPNQWEDITTDETGTLLIGANEQVYLRGHISQRYSAEVADLQVWYQMIGKTSKLRLPIR